MPRITCAIANRSNIMDVEALRMAATTLRDKLEFYKHRDPDASILLLDLEDLLFPSRARPNH